MDTLYDHRKSKKAPGVIIVSLIVFWIMFFAVYIFNQYNKPPYEYDNSVWRCSEPNIELRYNGTEQHCIYYSPDGEIELSISFTAGNDILIEEKENEAEFSENVPFKGHCVYDSEFFRVSVIKNELFEGDFEELEFVRVK